MEAKCSKPVSHEDGKKRVYSEFHEMLRLSHTIARWGEHGHGNASNQGGHLPEHNFLILYH